MNEFGKTGVIAGAAVVLTALAMWMGPREVRPDMFGDQGQEFWPAFKDKEENGKTVEYAADKVAELEVSEFREATSDVYQFNVKRDDKGRWTIPSHGNYPADAKDRMGKAAAMLIGLKKDTVVDDSKARHVDLPICVALSRFVMR